MVSKKCKLEFILLSLEGYKGLKIGFFKFRGKISVKKGLIGSIELQNSNLKISTLLFRLFDVSSSAT